MELLFYAIVGWIVGRWIANYHEMKGARISAEEEHNAELEVPILVLEKHKDILYLFEKGTDTFMCQGNTMKELATNLSSYKQIDLAIVEYGPAILWFINGDVIDKAATR